MFLPFGLNCPASLWHLFSKNTIMKNQKIKISSKDVFKVVMRNLTAIEWKLTLQKNRNSLNTV